MSQAVFSVDLYEVYRVGRCGFFIRGFGQCIRGKSVYDVLFPFMENIGKLSNIKSAIETSIGGNDLQGILTRIIFQRTEIEVDEQKRIISVLPNPIWGLDDEVKGVCSHVRILRKSVKKR